MSRYINADELTKFFEPFKNLEVPVNALLGQIKDTPTADVVEVRHGQWTGKTYKCSLCGKWVDPLQGDADMNYCPNCGARMDGEEE